jgi:hypothetical protein
VDRGECRYFREAAVKKSSVSQLAGSILAAIDRRRYDLPRGVVALFSHQRSDDARSKD